jgi:dihydroorotate dehydrogenase electron transfer subunit
MAVRPNKKIEELTIVRKELYDSNHLYFELQANHPYPRVLPGQFVQVQVKNNSQVFLRRPLSVHDWDMDKGVLSLWIKVIGKGTASLAEMSTGQTLNVIYPLGNTFSEPEMKEGVSVVGGGCGAAPLLYLARHLKTQGIIPDILLGARTADEILHSEKYEHLGNLHMMTEDGSAGGKGFVTHHPLLGEDINTVKQIYACGPDPMMKAVGRIADKNSIPCEVSLENMMACGIGACLCCVVKTNKGHVCTCTEGPVFDIGELNDWLYN